MRLGATTSKMFNSFQQPAQQTPDSLRQTSLLLSSASKGDVAGVKQLLDEGASINSSDYDKRTALHLAASEGHVPVVELLLKRGANANPVDRWGDTVNSSCPCPYLLFNNPNELGQHLRAGYSDIKCFIC